MNSIELQSANEVRQTENKIFTDQTTNVPHELATLSVMMNAGHNATVSTKAPKFNPCRFEILISVEAVFFIFNRMLRCIAGAKLGIIQKWIRLWVFGREQMQ